MPNFIDDVYMTDSNFNKRKVIDKNGNLFPNVNGNIYFVDSTNSDASDAATAGTSPDAPFATIDYAIGKCTASNGDVIYAMPGHAETIVAATGMVFDVAGVTLIGLGYGSLQPTITLGTATTATIAVSAANVRMNNIKVISALADVAVGVSAAATADGLTLEDCWFTDGGLALELVIGVSLATTLDNVTITNCRFNTTVSAETGGCASAIKLVGTHNYCRITDNYIHGHYTVAAIDGATGAGISIFIADNVIMQIDTGAGLAISLKSDTTGAVVRNLVCNLKDTAAGVVAAACCVAENYCSNAAGASGIIVPTVDT